MSAAANANAAKKNIWKAVWDHDAPLLAKVVGTPLVGLIFLGAIGSVFWLDLFYGVALVIIIPEWLYGAVRVE